MGRLCKRNISAHVFAAQCISRSRGRLSASISATVRAVARTPARRTPPTFSRQLGSSCGCPGRSMFALSTSRERGTRDAFAPPVARHSRTHRQRCWWCLRAAWTRSQPSRPMLISSWRVGPLGITIWHMRQVSRRSRRRRHRTVRSSGSSTRYTGCRPLTSSVREGLINSLVRHPGANRNPVTLV